MTDTVLEHPSAAGFAESVSDETAQRVAFITGKTEDMRGRTITLSVDGKRVVVEVGTDGRISIISRGEEQSGHR